MSKSFGLPNNPVIGAGTSIMGKVGIDQTTDGTTNKVQARNATHDNFNINANLQVGDADNSSSNQLHILDNTAVGNHGGVYITGTDATTPAETYVFNAIQVITDAVVTAAGNITGITAASLDAGTIIYGRYTSITLASGSVIAYQGK